MEYLDYWYLVIPWIILYFIAVYRALLWSQDSWKVYSGTLILWSTNALEKSFITTTVCLLYWDPTPFIIINFTTTWAQMSFIVMGWLFLRVHCNSLLQKLAKRLKSTNFCGVKHFYFITGSSSVTYDQILERSRDGQSRDWNVFVAEEVVVVTFSHHYWHNPFDFNYIAIAPQLLRACI